MPGDQPAPPRGNPKENLIERANVPELEILLLQQQLNARVRAGTLSGPPLPENGKLDAATEAKQREMEAFDAIALAKIEPRKPEDRAAQEAARADDERVLAFVREEFQHIGDTTYLDHDHKAPTKERIRKLEATFRRKWAAAGQAAEAIEALLREPVRPGSLLVADGAFDYGRLEYALATMRKLEQALATVPTDDADFPALAEKVAGYRAAIVAGLSGARPAARPATAAQAPAAEPAPAPAARPAPPPPRRVTADLPPPPATPSTGELQAGFVPDPEREKKSRELDMMGPESKLKLFLEHEGDASDPLVAQIAASIARTHPESFTPAMAARLDAYAMSDLARDEGRLAKVPPKLRLAMVKDFATRAAEGGDADATAAFGGVLAASLLKQHPSAAAELIANAPGDLKPRLTVAMLGRLTDEDLVKLPREALHALYKEIQGRGSADERRHLARLVRLMNKR